MTRLFSALLLTAALAAPFEYFNASADFQAAPQQPPAPAVTQPPVNESPSSPVLAAPDPAAVTFETALGFVLVSVKPDKIADYEAALVALQEALAQSTDAETRKVAASWRVLRPAAPADAKANTLYIHMLEPALAGVDYRPSLWLDKLLEGAPADLLAKYRDSLAALTKLPLVEFANMAVMPVPKPVNESPAAPAVPGKPANAPSARPRNAPPPKPGNVPPPKPVNASPPVPQRRG